MISVITLAMALYFAYVLDRETIGCFLALQETILEPRNTTKPPVDRRSSTRTAQSASKDPLTNIEGEWLI
jgi:hypothetical protein